MNVNKITEIGSGGFGIVDLVEDSFTHEQYARKTFHPANKLDSELEENVRKRFIKEVRLLSEINHKNVMPVVAVNLNIDPPSYLMPVCTAITNSEMEEWKRTNNIEEITKYFFDIFAGLEEMHSIGMIHRDIKPENILKLNGGYVVSDFCLVSFYETQITALTQTGIRMGWGYYTAPEITRELKNATKATDIFSLGCMLHDFFGTIDRIPCQTIIDYNSPIGDIIEICTRSDPRKRFQNIKDLRQSLVEALSVNEGNQVTSQVANDYLSYLKTNNIYDDTVLNQLLNFLDHNPNSHEAYEIYRDITSQIIGTLLQNNVLAKRFADLYSIWARSTEHAFARCDLIASNLELFFNGILDIETRANILLSLLIMGASHNRWYVEEKFFKYAKILDVNTCRRFVYEARVLGNEPKNALTHLERSICVSRSQLPQILQNYFNER